MEGGDMIEIEVYKEKEELGRGDQDKGIKKR